MLKPGNEIDIWVVEEQLGAGGMGTVYRCHNRGAPRIKAAIKTLETAVSRSPGAQARFIREAEILFALDHTNIVHVRNVRMDHDPPYLEMEFVEGEALEDMLQRGALDLPRALAFMEQMAVAVAYLHRAGIRHRDLKPANVLIRADGTLKVVDFGLAMEAEGDRLTQAGMTFGTVSYAPPEWVNPEALDPELWDLYSMGVCFWEMLTGRVAFPVSGKGSSRQQAMQVILQKQQHDPLDPGPDFHDDLRTLIKELTHPDPSLRLRGAELVASRVQQLTPERARVDRDRPATAPIKPRSANPSTFVFHDSTAAHSKAALAAARPSTHAPSDPQSTPSSSAVIGVAAGMVLVVLMVLVAVAVGVFTFRSLHTLAGVPTRPVNIAVAGLASDTPFSVTVDGRPAETVDGWVHHFGALEQGQVELRWVVGEGCRTERCPGDACAPWCGSGQELLEVEAGEGALVHPLSLPQPRSRQVRVLAPKIEGLETNVFIEQAIGTRAANNLMDFELLPGHYDVRARVGECPEAVDECTAGADCPDGCSAWRGEIDVPWGSGPLAIDVDLAMPVPAEPVTHNGKPRSHRTATAGGATRPPLTGPTKVPPDKRPAKVRPSAAPSPVSTADYATWLHQHPEWLRDAAIEAGRADGNYLPHWKGATPPPGGESAPMVSVSWYAASAYCRSHGGLADVEASPHSWSGAVYLEWRFDGSKPAWRSQNNTTSNRVRMKEANPQTGFRCAN